jgi:hypothetical protein
LSEIEQLKTRIDEAGEEGVFTTHIREDYDPAGQLMIRQLCDTDVGQYVQRKGMGVGSIDQKWRMFKSEFAPY